MKLRVLILLCLLTCSLGAETEETEEETIIRESAESPGGDYLRKLLVDIEHDSEKALPSIVNWIRSKDDRIVRFRISAEAKGKQRGFALLDGLTATLKFLSHENPSMQGRAAELVHLLSIENTHMAQMIGLQSWLPGANGMPQIMRIVERALEDDATDAQVEAGEEALEAVYSLIANSRDNLELAHDQKAGNVLSVAVAKGKTSRTRMWAAAGLQRVLADIYDTDDGRYASNVRRIYIAKAAREQAKGIVDTLVTMLIEKRVKPTTPRERWPSYLKRGAPDQSTIEAWAAAAAISVLGLEEDLHLIFEKAGAKRAICTLKSSPDALERSQALNAMAALDYDCDSDDDNQEL